MMIADNNSSTHVVLHDEERNDLTDHPHAVDEFLSLYASDPTHNEHRVFKVLRVRVDHKHRAPNAVELTTMAGFTLGADLATRLIVAHVATMKCTGQCNVRDMSDLYDGIATEMIVHTNTICNASEDLFGQICAIAEVIGVSTAEIDR